MPPDPLQSEFERLRAALLAATTAAARRQLIDELVAHYLPYLRLLAGPLLGQEHRRRFDSEDIRNTVGYRLAEKLRRGALELRSEAEFRALLRTIVRNRIRDLQRSGRREVAWSEDADQAVPDASVGRDEAVEKLLAEIERHLQPDEFYIFKQRYLEGRDLASIGAEFGLSADAVRMRLARVLPRLRAQLLGFETWFEP